MSAPQSHITRRVWAEVTKTPNAPITELACRAGVVKSTASRALHALRAAGYIDFPDRTLQARTILVPFLNERRKQRKQWRYQRRPH